MEIRVANIEIFWSNGSYETPIKFPDPQTFKKFENPNVALSSLEVGTVVLEGDWSYAWYRDNFYFLSKIEYKDIDKKIFKYSMIRDLNYALYKCEDLVLEGELVKCSDKKILAQNKQYAKPLNINPVTIEFKNLDKKEKADDFQIIEHTYQTDPFCYVVTEEAWDRFDSQIKAIPNPNDKKTKDAILATLVTTKVDSWKSYLIFYYLRNLIEGFKKNKSAFKITKIDSYQPLNGNHQLTDEATPWGKYIVPLEQLGKIDLSGLTDVIPLTRDTLIPLRNKKVGDLEYIPAGKKSVRGYFEGAVFYPDEKPWENKNPTSAGENFPLDNKDFGINSNLDFVQLSKAYEGTFKVHLDISTSDFLKTKKSTLEEIDRIIIRRNRDWQGTAQGFHSFPGNQGVFMKLKLPSVDDFHFYKHAVERFLPPVWFWYAWGETGQNLQDVYKMEGGLPKKEDQSFDYDKIAEWITKGKLEIWYDGNVFYNLRHVMFGFSEHKKENSEEIERIPHIISFRDHAFADRFYALIKTLYSEVKATDTKLKKDAFLRGVYNRLSNVVNDEYYFIDKRELAIGIHLFNLQGTNYFLALNDGKASLIIKDINEDERTEYSDIYEGNIEIPDVYQEINTRRILVTFNKETELPISENHIENLQVKKLSPTNKLNIQDNILVDYSSRHTRILDLFAIPLRTHEKKVADRFDPVNYENYLMQYRKTKEELDLLSQARENTRMRETYEYGYQRAELTIEYQQRLIAGIGAITGSLTQSAIMGGSIYAKTPINRAWETGYRKEPWYISPAFGTDLRFWEALRDVGSGFFGLPFSLGMAARSGYTLQQDLQKISRQKDHLDRMNEFNIASRVIENASYNNKHLWLDIENRKNIERSSLSVVSTEYNSRDVIDEFTKMNNVGEIYVRLHKPNQDQIHLINEHYGQYGVDTNIPKYVLTWKDVRDKINIWGFRFIKWVNIKDPILRDFVYGKFINGVKLIKPTF